MKHNIQKSESFDNQNKTNIEVTELKPLFKRYQPVTQELFSSNESSIVYNQKCIAVNQLVTGSYVRYLPGAIYQMAHENAMCKKMVLNMSV